MTAGRLERALSVWLEYASRSGDPGEPAALLELHPDLRDLLEPMLAGAPTSPTAAAAAPSRLGDFELVREIGRGGMGVVWEARQRSLDRRVAIKLLAPEVTVNAAAVARLRREATTAARLNHPNLVKVLGLGCEGAVHFLALELVDGEPVDRADRSAREIAELIAQVADALECVHGAGVVHRDVKPGNILVTAGGTAVLTDFGLARDPTAPSWSLSGAFAGTPQYASPEQLRGGEVDARSDVFSLGVTLFELLTGERPYPGATPAAVIEAIARAHDGPDPRDRRGDLPRDLAAVVRKAIAPQRADRYASAAAFAVDLRAWCAGRSVDAKPPPLLARAWRWSRREPWRAGVVAVLAVAVPLVAGLVGHHLAMRPLVRAGEALAREQQVEQRLADAYLALSVGEIARALAHLDAALALDPEHREAHAIHAVVAGTADSAQQTHAENGSAADPQSRLLEALATAARHLLDTPDRALRASADELGDWRAARAAFPAISLATRLAPRPRLPLFALLASLSGIANVPVYAREAAETLAVHWPDLPAARRARARAMRAFDPAGAAAELQRLVDESPGDVQLRFELVGALCRLGDKAAAARESAAVAALAPADAMAQVCLAEHLLEARRPAEAIEPYRAAIAIEPRNARTHYNLGVALSAAGDEVAAADAYRRAAELDPGHAPAWANLAQLAIQRGDLAEGLDASSRGVAADPDLEPASFNLRSAAIALRRFDLCAAELTRRAGRRPGEPAVHRDLAAFLLEHPDLPDASARALAAALRALALSHWADREAARLAAAAWQNLGVPRAAEIVSELDSGTIGDTGK